LISFVLLVIIKIA